VGQWGCQSSTHFGKGATGCRASTLHNRRWNTTHSPSIGVRRHHESRAHEAGPSTLPKRVAQRQKTPAAKRPSHPPTPATRAIGRSREPKDRPAQTPHQPLHFRDTPLQCHGCLPILDIKAHWQRMSPLYSFKLTECSNARSHRHFMCARAAAGGALTSDHPPGKTLPLGSLPLYTSLPSLSHSLSRGAACTCRLAPCAPLPASHPHCDTKGHMNTRRHVNTKGHPKHGAPLAPHLFTYHHHHHHHHHPASHQGRGATAAYEAAGTVA